MSSRSSRSGSRTAPAPRYLLIGLGYVVLYLVVGLLLRGRPLALSVFGNVGLLIPPIAVCVFILRHRRRWEGCQRLFWDTIAISTGLWIIGHFGWAFEQIFFGRQSWLQWHTVFSLCGGIGPLIALLARPHRGVRADAVGTVGLALASYGLLAVFIYSYFVLVPGLVPGVRDPRFALLELVQVNRALLFASMISATIVARRTAWYRPYLLSRPCDRRRVLPPYRDESRDRARQLLGRHAVRSCLDSAVPPLRAGGPGVTGLAGGVFDG